MCIAEMIRMLKFHTQEQPKTITEKKKPQPTIEQDRRVKILDQIHNCLR